MNCPQCGKTVDATSEHAFFEYDVTAVRCTQCLWYSILGSGAWIQFPKWMGDKKLLLGARVAETDSEQWALALHDLHQSSAENALRWLARQVYMKDKGASAS